MPQQARSQEFLRNLHDVQPESMQVNVDGVAITGSAVSDRGFTTVEWAVPTGRVIVTGATDSIRGCRFLTMRTPA